MWWNNLSENVDDNHYIFFLPVDRYIRANELQGVSLAFAIVV